MMDTVKFILPPAIGSLGVAKLIACQPSALGSLQIGIGCLATIATASYYICKKYAPKQHTKSNETESDSQEGAERTDLESIYEQCLNLADFKRAVTRTSVQTNNVEEKLQHCAL